nr:MAG TPA: hypothetical protein [Caudoviricetes sp.]
MFLLYIFKSFISLICIDIRIRSFLIHYKNVFRQLFELK